MKLPIRLLLALSTLVTTLQADVPVKINYQGSVYDSNGNAIGAAAAVNRKVIFRLYSASTGGTLLWNEEQTVTIYKGEFSIVLGNGNTPTGSAANELATRPALDTVFTSNSTTRFLEVMVDNGDNVINSTDTPISPRQLITTGFYAFHALVADGIASSSDLTINPPTGSGTASNYGLGWYGTGRLWGTTAVDGPVLYGNAGGALGSNASGTRNTALLWNATGQVGIGASSTSTFATSNKLTLQGDDTATAARQLIIRGNTTTDEAFYLGYETTNNRATLQSYASTSTPTTGPLLLNPSGGTVGIGTGTTAPVARLTVEGSISATGSGGYTFGTGGDNDGGMFSPADGTLSFRVNGTERFRINSTGSVSTNGNIEMPNDTNISGYNNATSAQEACFWPRSGNGTFLNYGSAGFNIRNSGNALKMFINNDGKVGINTNSPTDFFSVDAGSATATASTSTAIAHVGNGDVAAYFGVYDGTGEYGVWLQSMRRSDQLTFPLCLNPNGGKVAIGRKNAYNQLHLFGANGTTAPSHQNSASIYLQDSNSTSGSGGALLFGAMSTNATDNGGMFAGIKAHATNVSGLQTVGDLAFYTRRLGTDGSPTESMRILANGSVRINTTSAQGQLNLGTIAGTYATVGYLDTNGGQSGDVGSASHLTSIYADGRIVAPYVGIHSDRRIKTDLLPTNSVDDLKTLMGIEVTDYHFKDNVANGKAPQKKVIAQQLETVYPQSVTLNTGVVPDIFKKATAKGGWVKLATDLKVGERVKLIDDKEQSVHEVLEVRDGAFRTDYKTDTEKLFVYGREVKDFRTVDYDAIAMLNVSATQQIKKEKDLELKVLKEQNVALQARVEALEARDQIREAKQVAQQAEQNAKLAALERLITRQRDSQPALTVNHVLPQRAE